MKHKLLLAMLVILFASCGETDSGDKPEAAENTESAALTTTDEATPEATTETEAAEPAEPAETTAEPELSAAERFQEIQADFTKARNEFMVTYRAAKTDEERQKIFNEQYPKPDSYASRINSLIDEGIDESTEFDALYWLSTAARSEEASDRLFEDHLENENMHKLCMGMSYSRPSQENEDRLRMLIEKSPHHTVKGWATFALASYLARNGEVDEEVEALFTSVVDEYNDIEFRGDKKLSDMATAGLFEAKNLVVGKEAPDIEGADLDGKEFKLSDYRGKVVFLDFWGDW